MLFKRVLTAAIGIPLAIYIIQYGRWLYAAVVCLLALLAWSEYARMLRHKKIAASNTGGFISILLLLACAWLGNPEETVLIFWLILLFLLVRTIWFARSLPFESAAFTGFGILYIGLSFMHLLLLRQTDASVYVPTIFGQLSVGTLYIWVAFIGTWASDTFAYFVGSAWGKRKLAPLVSPGKSIEGAIGGLAGCVFSVTILGQAFSIAVIHSVMLGILIGIVAPLGDLAESALKRYCGVKDSGAVLPGHGGILDRFDSIMFSVPAVYYYVRMIVLQGMP